MMSTTAISEFSERIEKTIIGMEELLNINMEIGKSLIQHSTTLAGFVPYVPVGLHYSYVLLVPAWATNGHTVA